MAVRSEGETPGRGKVPLFGARQCLTLGHAACVLRHFRCSSFDIGHWHPETGGMKRLIHAVAADVRPHTGFAVG